jgi:hypothetical protein
MGRVAGRHAVQGVLHRSLPQAPSYHLGDRLGGSIETAGVLEAVRQFHRTRPRAWHGTPEDLAGSAIHAPPHSVSVLGH